MTRPWLPRLALALGSTAVLLAAAEAALRLASGAPDDGAFRMQALTPSLAEDLAGRYARHPLRAYSTAPGFRAAPGHLGRDATADWPFRGRPGEPLPPAVSLPRVLLLGDSCVYGAGLDACDTPAERLARELDARGLPPDRVAVVPLGVPGYSTEQLLPLLREALGTLRPAVTVLYVAAWNDQAPARRAPDRELLAALADPSPADWLRARTRLGALLLAPDDPPQEELLAAWRAGAPLRGWRVPEADVGPNVTAMLQACAAAGSEAVVLAPPHPPATRRDHPRTARDARAVLEAGARAGVPAFDGQSVLQAALGDPARGFGDYVHPSPEGSAALAAALAEPVARVLHELLAAREDGGCAADPLRVLEVQPREAFALGDVPVRVTLENWNRFAPLPAVLVGGAPLLGLRATGESQVEGWLPANGAGTHGVLVQDAFSAGVLRDALELRDPQFELQPGPPARLLARARPGDRLALLVAGGLRETPHWTPRGALRLAKDARPLPQELVLDAAGRATLELPALPDDAVWVQALWAPPGEAPADSPLARWTAPVRLDPP